MNDEGPALWEFGGTMPGLCGDPPLAEWYAYAGKWYSPTNVGSKEYFRRCFAMAWRKWGSAK